jgi:hypothetical protein
MRSILFRCCWLLGITALWVTLTPGTGSAEALDSARMAAQHVQGTAIGNQLVLKQSNASVLAVGTYAFEVYNDPGYTGASCYSATPMTANIHSTCNDKISSVWLQSGWSVRLFRDPNQAGPTKCISASDADLSNDVWSDGSSLNDSASSFVLFQQVNCGVGRYALEVYNDPGHWGPSCYSAAAITANIHATCNDKISSVWLQPGWSVRLFRDPNQAGPTKCISVSDPDLSNDVWSDGLPLDNSASSFILYEQVSCGIGRYYLEVYSEPGYWGTMCLSTTPIYANIHFVCNDTISSIMIKPGWSVRFFRDQDFLGPTICLSASDPDLSNDTFSDGSPLNDTVSSFALYAEPYCVESQ